MKYTAETTENGVTETLELDGSIYKKEWIREKTGVMRCKQKDAGVMYLYMASGSGGGITVMLNADGTPKIWQGKE